MATTMIPEAPVVRPSPRVRYVQVRANLLPDEVVSARRADVLRRRVLISLCALVAVLAGGYAFSWWQTSSARSDRDAVLRQTTSLQQQQHDFDRLVQAQNGAQTIRTQLQNLMVGDLSWKSMLTTLQSQAPAGVEIVDVSGTITAGAGAAAGGTTAATGTGLLNQTGKQQVGTLSIDGTAHDKNAIAAYADHLSRIKGLTAPLPTAVTASDNSLTFSLSVIITSDALGGRYAKTATQPTGGK